MAGKREIVADIMQSMGDRVLKKDVEEIVTRTFRSIGIRTKKRERVTVKGFGSFEEVDRKEKKGHNPQTGEDIIMAAYRKLVLKVKVKKGVRK